VLAISARAAPVQSFGKIFNVKRRQLEGGSDCNWGDQIGAVQLNCRFPGGPAVTAAVDVARHNVLQLLRSKFWLRVTQEPAEFDESEVMKSRDNTGVLNNTKPGRASCPPS
jgi:hypothetical protein